MRLLRVYPGAWRARYGEELTALVEEIRANGRMSWRVRVDLLRAGAAERVRMLGLNGLPPLERAREGSLLVLYSWMLFVIGGFGVEKASEHWQAATPAARRGLPSAAFDVLFVAAGIGSVLVLIGVAVLLPRVAALIQAGGWPKIRRAVVRATVLSVLAVTASSGLAAWAHSLTPAARNGSDAAYSGAFVALVVLFAACLFAWAAAAAATARNLSLSVAVLRLEVWLGAAVSVAMAVMTIATVLWWGSLAAAAPWFFDGRPVGSSASALVSNMVVPTVMMFCATSLGLIGAARAAKAFTDVGPLNEA
jgi:hypothetical protein